ncbi:MAG: PASTA domain-containing protein [Bacteroidota bacterium]
MKLFPDTLKGLLLHSFIVILLAVCGTLVFFYVYLPYTTNHGETITVPNLYGMKLGEMEDFLNKRDLRYEINDSTYSDEYEPLTILKQYPKAGSKVKQNRKVFISVNRVTPPTVPMPKLLDRSLRNAEAVLKSNELKLGTITYIPSQFLNLVLEMKINDEPLNEGDLVSKGSVIDLFVGSGGDSPVRDVPDLIGLPLDEAETYLRGRDLQIGIIEVLSDTTGEDVFVIRQNPAEGKQARLGDLIDLWIVSETDSLYQQFLTAGEETEEETE